MPESKLKLGMRTIKKVIAHLGLGCSNCGWNLAPCDIHHVVEQCNGGSDEHSNLTLLCPNCHRLAHAGKLITFKSLEEHFSEVDVNEVFDGLSKFNRRAKARIKSDRIANRCLLIEDRKQKILSSGIDLSKRGWQTSLGKFLGISSQKAAVWAKKHMSELLTNC